MHNGASRANRLRTSASVRTAVFYSATLDSRSAAVLAHCRPAVLAVLLSVVLARHLYATLAGGRPCCAINFIQEPNFAPTKSFVGRWRRSGVDDEVDGGARVSGNDGTKQRGVIKVDGGVDKSQAQVQQTTAAAGSSRVNVDGRRRSPLRSGGGLSATTHVTAGGIALTYGYFKFSPDRITVAPLRGRWNLITWRESIEPQLEVVGLKGFVDGTVPIPSVDDVGLRGEFRAAHLLTFMVISRCCSPVVQQGCGGGGRRRECWIYHDPDHHSYECPDHDDSDEDDTKGGRSRSTSRRPRQDANPREEKQTSKQTSSTKDVDNSSKKSRGNGEASCSMVGVAEPTVSLAPEAGEDFQAVAATVQAYPMAVLLDSGCTHHLMGSKAVFVNMVPSDSVKHVRGFNGALQPVEGPRNRCSARGGQKAGPHPRRALRSGCTGKPAICWPAEGERSAVEMLVVVATGEVLGRASYNGRVLCTDLHPYLMWSQSTEVVALRTIVSATKSTPDRLHARLAHVSVDTIKSSAKHTVATRLNITPSTRADPPCVLCVGGKLARHTFPDKGSDAVEALAVVHIDLCGPFRVAAKDGSLFFLLLKDRHTRFVMAEQEMRTAVESVRTMLLHMGVQHHWWHLALRQAVWVRNYLERSTTPPGTTLYQLLTGKKPDLTLARVWGCMVQFMVPEQ
ncbi:unnamed protein product [Closterium sp. NIES-53]